MALSPQRIRDTHFRSARKGYDQVEVDSFVQEVATALEAAQNDATAMEARARAAVARLQELSQGASAESPAGAASSVDVRAHVEESETISRTLLLAQRTADQTLADAQAEADRVLSTAREEATSHIDGVRVEAAQLVEDAKADARRAGESERVQVEGEVQALLARRDFLESDVDHLEQYLLAQRERITEAVAELHNLVERIPGGLGEMRRPLLSAAADADGASDDETLDQERSEISEITKVAEGAVDDEDELPPADPDRRGDGTPSGTTQPLFDERPERVDVVRPWDAERS